MKLINKSRIIAFGFLVLLASCHAIEGMGYLKSWLPTFGIQSKATQEQIETAKQCSICLVDFAKNDQLAVLNCDPKTPHIFHKNCLNEWINAGNLICPICRDSRLLSNNYIYRDATDAGLLIAASALLILANNGILQISNRPVSMPCNIKNVAFLSSMALSCFYLIPKLLGSSHRSILLGQSQRSVRLMSGIYGMIVGFPFCELFDSQGKSVGSAVSGLISGRLTLR